MWEVFYRYLDRDNGQTLADVVINVFPSFQEAKDFMYGLEDPELIEDKPHVWFDGNGEEEVEWYTADGAYFIRERNEQGA